MNSGIFKSIMGTIDSCPYAPRSKQIVPEVGAALVSGGASLLGNILGFGSNESANQTNMEIAKMNNAQQYKMFQEQMAYNTDMWNKQNKYNSPKETVQRLLAAGINPAAVYGSGSSTPASQLTAPSAPNLQQAHVSTFTPDMSGVGQAVNSYFENQLVNAQKKKTNAERAHTEFLTLEGTKKLLPTLELLRNQAKKEGVLGDLAKQQLAYANASFDYNIKQLVNDIRAQDDQHRFMEHQTQNMKLQNALMEIQVAYAPRMNEAQLSHYYASVKQLIAQVGLINANETLSRAEVNTEVQRACSEFYKASGLQSDAKIKGAIENAVIGIENKNWENYDWDRRHRIFQGYLGAFNQATQGASSAAALKLFLGK